MSSALPGDDTIDVAASVRHSFRHSGQPARTSAPADLRRIVGGQMRILVVERDPHVRELEAHYLTGAGFVVEFAQDGNAALARARTLHPDLVITEILVPHLDGLALCRQLKADPETADISVLVFSILASRARALEAGADAFLMKPLGDDRLLAMVHELLENRVTRQLEAQA